MKPEHWLDAADQLVNESRPGAPRQVNLRCVVSMVYYALFHWLANCAADALAGSARPRNRNWTRVYRGLDHWQVKRQCRQGRVPADLPPTVRRFATELAEMQGRRHTADYDPSARFSKPDATAFIANANSMLQDLRGITPADRRDLAIHVLFRERPEPL